jgi:hypothetical protein
MQKFDQNIVFWEKRQFFTENFLNIVIIISTPSLHMYLQKDPFAYIQVFSSSVVHFILYSQM